MLVCGKMGIGILYGYSVEEEVQECTYQTVILTLLTTSESQKLCQQRPLQREPQPQSYNQTDIF